MEALPFYYNFHTTLSGSKVGNVIMEADQGGVPWGSSIRAMTWQ